MSYVSTHNSDFREEKILAENMLKSGLLRCLDCKRENPIRMGIPFLYSDDVKKSIELNEILEWTVNDVKRIIQNGMLDRKYVAEAKVQYHFTAAKNFE